MWFETKTIRVCALGASCLAIFLGVAGCGSDDSSADLEREASECDPSYSGACLDLYASDYDCEGGSGDGPNYTGAVAVVGDDHYGLDSDNDGYGCE